MASKKKVLTSVVALGTAAALTLGGTFAWQSISQTALNEGSDIVNPGGRLHSDVNYESATLTSSDIYVENFTDPDNGGEDIFARIRLEEYMEIVMNYGVEGVETVENIAGSKTPKEDSSYTADEATHQDEFDYEYDIHYFGGEDNATDEYWDYVYGDTADDVYYMPTYNKNKDSLVADVNGEYAYAVGGISDRDASQYSYTEVAEGETTIANEIYDGDIDTLDELQDKDIVKDLIESGKDSAYYTDYEDDIEIVENVEHTAAKVGTTKGVISMDDWLDILGEDEYDEETHGNYWVYDEDGWIYWTSPIKAGTATGLLLDGFELKNVMDDTWYYAMNVVGQFITADDAGKEDGTGFYDTEAGEVPSESAETLLKAIGVRFDETADDDDDEENVLFSMRSITSDEWDLLCDVTNESDDIMHWRDIGSWTSTAPNTTSHTIRGKTDARTEEGWWNGCIFNYIGARFAFEAKDSEIYADLSVGDVVTVGTLYVGSDPVKVPTNPNRDGDITSYDIDKSGDVHTKITLGNAIEDTDYQMQAIYVGNGLFIGDRCMLNYISWEQIADALTK